MTGRSRALLHVSAALHGATDFSINHTVSGEIKQVWQLPRCAVRMARIRETGVGVSKLIEEGMRHCIDCREAFGWFVL